MQKTLAFDSNADDAVLETSGTGMSHAIRNH
jgi:hypothetical protein